MTQQTEQKRKEDKPETATSDSAAGSGEGTKVIERRNNRGCKSEDFYTWPDLPFDDMDSPLAVQQYIQQLIRKDPADIDEILKLPEGQDLGAWKIEHLRLFCMQLNRLATKLQDCCQPDICNQMTATEQWIFLCAAHKQPNECPAIDYTRHTLDGAASLLNSNKYFPSRVTIKESSVAKLGSVCRRVYRIFSHAYYHHFQVFDEFERETHLCKRFSKFVTIFDLMSKDSLIVPSDGSKPDTEGAAVQETVTSTTESTTESTTSSQQKADLPEKNIKQEGNSCPDLNMEIKSDIKIKPDLKSKKSIEVEEMGNEHSPATTTAWTPSHISTNTIVKGTSASAHAVKNYPEEISKSTDAIVANATTSVPISGSGVTTSTRNTNTKNGVESEA